MGKFIATDKVDLWLLWAGRSGVGMVWGGGDGQGVRVFILG